MTTQTGYVMTLANSIIGVSLLAMPYCFKQCGLALGIILLLASNVATRLACHFLVKSGVMCRRKSFEYVAYHAFGSTGKLMVELGVIGFMMGTSVAFFVVMGDLAPAILSKMLLIDNNDPLRTTVLVVAGIFIVMPLSLLRNIESLAAISTVTMMFYILLMFKVLTESFPHLATADWPTRVNYWRPEGILQCFPIFAMALSCQTQVFEIFEVLPNPTLERMNNVVRAAVGLCTGLYIAVGFLGYVAYARESFGGNILLTFAPSTSTDLFQLGFVVSIALSFPIVVFPCRASLNSLLCKKGAQYHELTTQSSFIPDARFKLLTLAIVGSALVTGLLIPSIEVVLGFVGSTIGVAICIIFPAAAFVNISNKETSERLVAKVILIIGLAVMVLGVYGNLDVVVKTNLKAPSLDGALINSPVPPILQLQIPKDLPFKESDVERQRVVERRQPPQPLPKLEEPVLRREPPVPVEPAPQGINKDPVAPPQAVTIPSISAFSVDPIKPKVVEALPHAAEPKEAQKSELVPHSVAEIPNKLGGSIQSEVKSVPNAGPKKLDTIHEDAIAREELELKEADSQQKKEEDRKAQELLKKLKEHQEEQKQLLKEQQNILEEIKSRDGELIGDGGEVKVIQPQKFNENIEKIQEVIDDLKERKQIIDKTKGEKIAEEKKKKAERKDNSKPTDMDDKVPVMVQESQKHISPKVVTNLSVASEFKVIPPSPPLNKPEKADPVIAGRDILGVNTAPAVDREKRDTEENDGSCIKTQKIKENVSDEPAVVSPAVGNVNVVPLESGIKESNVISDPLVGNLQALPAVNLISMIDEKNDADYKVAKLLARREETRRKKRK